MAHCPIYMSIQNCTSDYEKTIILLSWSLLSFPLSLLSSLFSSSLSFYLSIQHCPSDCHLPTLSDQIWFALIWSTCLSFWRRPQSIKTKIGSVCVRQGFTNRCSLAAGLRGNEERMRKWKENEEMKRDWLSTFPHFLFISFLFIHFPYQKLSHFVAKY